MDFRFALPVLFLRTSMVLLTMLYPGEASRAVESDKVCTCFTGLLDVCVQALAMQLHALIRITSMMSCLFLADIPGHNQNALRDISSVPGRHSQPWSIWLLTQCFTFGLWCILHLGYGVIKCVIMIKYCLIILYTIFQCFQCLSTTIFTNTWEVIINAHKVQHTTLTCITWAHTSCCTCPAATLLLNILQRLSEDVATCYQDTRLCNRNNGCTRVV